jgi:hypothetical protein
MADITDLGGLSDQGWPYNNVDVDKALFRLLVDSVADRIRNLPRDWSDYDSDLIVARSDAAGIAPAGNSGNDFVDFRRLQLKGARTYPVAITSSQPLTMLAHCGHDLMVNSSSAVALTAAPSSDPDEGLSDGFNCRIWRVGSGAVSVTVDGAYDNQHPNLHTKVGNQGLFIGVVLWGTQLFIAGDTAL